MPEPRNGRTRHLADARACGRHGGRRDFAGVRVEIDDEPGGAGERRAALERITGGEALDGCVEGESVDVYAPRLARSSFTFLRNSLPVSL